MPANSSNLIVPIHIEALCVNNQSQGETFTGASANFKNLPKKSQDGVSWINGPYLAEVVEKFPGITLEKGIHLHWALPDVITQGAMSESEDLTFPAAPNRWMITRIYTSYKDANNPLNHIQSWVVESDYVSLDSSERFPVTFPCETDKQFHFYLGKVYTLSDWINRDKTDQNYLKIQTGKDLTSVGYGDINFSSYYPNCRNVFGFYDSLADDFAIPDFDPDSNQITYLVNGWYEDENVDVLKNYVNDQDNISWKFSGDFPSRTLCNGIAQNVIWDISKSYDDVKDQSDLKVTIGNNDIECLSALFASDQPDNKLSAEYQLNALQLGILNKLGGKSDLPAKLEEELHDKAFDRAIAGNTWEVIKKADPSKNANALTNAATTVEENLTDAAAKLLNDLNVLQYQYDKNLHQINSLREALYMDWYRSMQIQYLADKSGASSALPDTDMNDFVSDLRDYISSEKDDILSDLVDKTGLYQYDDTSLNCTSSSDTASLAQQIITKLNNLKQELVNETVEYQIHLTESPRYFRPKDPVVLLSGDMATPSLRFGYDHTFDESGMLVCRRSTEILQTLTHKTSSLIFDIADLQLDNQYQQLPMWNDISLLIAECFISDLNQSNYIAYLLLKKAGSITIPTFSQLAQAMQVFQTNLLQQKPTDTNEFSVRGVLPVMPLGINIWQANPCTPLYLNWEIKYHPVQRLISGADDNCSQDMITNNFSLDQFNVDLNAKPDLSLGDYQGYSGTVFLTPHALIDLKAELTQYLKENENENADLSALLENTHAVPLLSQSMGGFHDALMMRHEVLQMQVKDPEEDMPFYQSFVQSIADNVHSYLSTNPLPNNDFNPIRGGFMEVTSLKLIDTFGKVRILETDPDHLIKSENLSVNTGNPNVDQLVYLPPRLSQHARLLFRWISANDNKIESNLHPASSPICGWIIPDLLYEGLFFYDQDGSPLGVINLINNRSATRWVSFPKEGASVLSSGDINNEITEIKQAVKNVHLLNFILSIMPANNAADSINRSAVYLDQLFNAINTAVGTIIPQNINEENSLAVLMGRPLALVRASLELDIKGLPVHELGWEALQNETQDDPKIIRNTRGFTQVNFPVHMGDLSQVTDGLVGFYKETDSDTDYNTFYSPAAKDGQNIVVKPTDETIMLTANPDAKPQFVTMLVDPRVNIHATTGILPIKSISIPADQYEAALKKLQLAFQVHPLLASKESISMYKPLIPGYEWKWLYAANGVWKSEPTITKPSLTAQTEYSPQIIKEGWLVLSPEVET